MKTGLNVQELAQLNQMLGAGLAVEHIAARLDATVELVSRFIPAEDKPTKAKKRARVSLEATEDSENG